MAKSGSVMLALVALLMQHDVIQGLSSPNRTMRLTPTEIRKGLMQRLAKQWHMGAPIELPVDRKQKMTIEDYNKLVTEIVEDTNGSHVFNIGEFKPAEKLSSDRHYFVGKNGEVNKLPNFRHQKQKKLNKLDQNLSRKQMTSHRQKRASVESQYLDYVSWPDKRVPFITSNMLPGDEFLPWIQEGVDMFHSETCLQWVPRSDELEYVDFMGGDQEGFCAAYIGRIHDARTPVYLDQVTDNCNADYVVIHEMLHAIGLEHEQSRPDRNSYLTTNWECIIEETVNNYLKRPLATDVEYDWTSIMQYNPVIFNKCGVERGTMQLKNSVYDFLLYVLSRRFTHYDTQTIVEAYDCDEGCTDNCENGGFIRKTVDNDQCHCRCPEYLTGDTCASRTSTCGDIIELQEGETKQFTTSSFPGSYPVGEKCSYLIKAPAYNRIVIKLKTLDVPCGHDLEFRVHLMGERGISECGTLSSEREFVTFPNSESNTAMVILHADDTSITPRTGASLEVTAFESGCLDNPCSNGGRCDEDIDIPAYCICPPGYSGDTCNFVRATDTVGCDLQSDVEGVCSFTDVSVGPLKMIQTRNPEAVLFPYLLAYTVGIITKDEALLESNVEFEDTIRCLSFEEAAIREADSNVRVKTTYIEKDGSVRLVSETEDTGGFFVARQATLSRHLKKVRFSATAYGGGAAVADILISPGPCSDATCDSLSFTFCDNGGLCDDSSGTLSCSCIAGFSGTYCEIPPPQIASVRCTFEDGETCPFVNSPPTAGAGDWIVQTGPTPQRGTGPLGAYEGKRYLRTNARPNAVTEATLKLEMELSAMAQCLVLNYMMNGIHVESLKVINDGVNVFTVKGNKRNRWYTKAIDVTTTEDSELTIVGKSTNRRGDIAIDDLELFQFPCDKILICTFERNYLPCTSGKRTKMRRKKGATSVSQTGPQKAHDGYYFVYLRSDRVQTAVLNIPHSFSGAGCLSFYYHMYGTSIGSLTMDIKAPGSARETIYRINGNQGENWHFIAVNIPVIDNRQVRIKATRANADGLGDISIDTVVLKNFACT